MLRWTKCLRWGLAVLALAALTAGLASAGAWDKEVVLRTADGVRIDGTFYAPVRPGPRPSVILLHMLNRSQRDWEEFARTLTEEGYAVLAIDLRGHGKSIHGVGSWRSFTDAGFQAMAKDVAAAHQYLRKAPEADGERLAVIGASIGANVALIYGSREPAVKTLVLLSPGLEYRGVETREAMRLYAPRPVLIAASREDSYSAQSSAALDSLAVGRHRLVMYDQAGHGTRMFDKVPGMAFTLLRWLASTL
jgi:pimeloyl-ACP methyl ester carboxylesterase